MDVQNNIFTFATKELSQDAFLCWSINWLAQDPTHPLYPYGKAMLDLLLGKNRQKNYEEVKILPQFKKIDVLVLYKVDGKAHALIIEDKTNTSEHDNQMTCYKEALTQRIAESGTLEKYKDPVIHLAYVKTGIMYDEDVMMKNKEATVIELSDLLEVISPFARLSGSEILQSFYDHIVEVHDSRVRIEKLIHEKNYEEALKDPYGQYRFLDLIFSKRSKGTSIGTRYENDAAIAKNKLNSDIMIDSIYAGANRSGEPWTEYCFWGSKYPEKYVLESDGEFHYHYLFWRIDCKVAPKIKGSERGEKYYYIALRHYDEHANSGVALYNKRKKAVYGTLRDYAKGIEANEKYKNIFSEFGTRENYKESDLLFIKIKDLSAKSLDEIRTMLTDLTENFIEPCAEIYKDFDKKMQE